MKRRYGTSGAVRFPTITGEYQSGSPVAFHYTGSDDSNYASVPCLAIHDHAVCISQPRRVLDALVSFLNNARLFGLAFPVQMIKTSGQFSSPRHVLNSKQVDDIASHVHSSGSIQTRRQAKRDVGGSQQSRTIQL